MTCWTYRIITSFTARVNFPSVHRVLKKPVRVCMTPHFLWHHILKEFNMIIFTGCSFSQGAHLWFKPHGYQNLLNRRPDTSVRWWTGTIFTRLKSQTMNMIMHDDALHPLDLTPLSPVWNLWYSGWARYDLFSSSALTNRINHNLWTTCWTCSYQTLTFLYQYQPCFTWHLPRLQG